MTTNCDDGEVELREIEDRFAKRLSDSQEQRCCFGNY